MQTHCKYKILQELGTESPEKGHFLVEECQSHSKRVIKKVDLTTLSDFERTAAIKEAKILTHFRHPNILGCQEFYKTKKNKLCTVVAYADGGDLDRKITDQKGVLMSETVVLDIFVQICLALKHAHDCNIIHRDLKPNRILFMRNGNVKLSEFEYVGLRTVCTSANPSPERVRDSVNSLESNIWSLGVVLYQMCALRLPFEGSSVYEVVVKITEGRFPPISSHYSSDLKQLLSSLLAIAPASRPTIHQVLQVPFLRQHLACKLATVMSLKELLPVLLVSPAARNQSELDANTLTEGLRSLALDSFFVSVGSGGSLAQQHKANCYLDFMQAASSRERWAILMNLRQRRSDLRNRQKVHSTDFDEYEAYIYELQVALLDLHLSEDLPLQSTAERLRFQLETALGEDRFLTIYRRLAGLEETAVFDRASEVNALKRLMSRRERAAYEPLFQQLIGLETR